MFASHSIFFDLRDHFIDRYLLIFSKFNLTVEKAKLLLKTVQFLSASGNRSNFRVLARNSYAENEAIILDAEVYDQSYSLVNTPDVSLMLLRPDGTRFPFTFSKSGNAYSLNAGFLAPGEYRYDANVLVGDKRYSATGRFSVTPIQAEREETVRFFKKQLLCIA